VAILDFRPHPWVLAAAVLLDALVGDPYYSMHPVRLIGRSLQRIENGLWRLGAYGYFGGIVLFLALAIVWAGGIPVAIAWLPEPAKAVFEVYVVYSLLALRDLIRHGWDVEKAARADDLHGARKAISRLVGRDTTRMDLASCRRAAIESLSENLTDGFISPIFWYALAGLPGIVLFKVVSTMDSMVGYKTPRYLKFGWCGARTDDLMNWIPARMTWLLLSVLAAILPGYSGSKAFRIGWQQHAIVPGPNSGWSEAAIAGALERRLIGPIWSEGRLVTDVWLGLASDAPAGEGGDLRRAAVLVTVTGLFAAGLAVTAIAAF
jgi:adenosylcobinamide-phosphate synthase